MVIEKLDIQKSATLREVMICIDQNLKGICFILEGRRLVGVMTDGDVRRSMLKGAEISDSVDLIMNRNFFSLPIDSSFDLIQKILINTNTYLFLMYLAI